MVSKKKGSVVLSINKEALGKEDEDVGNTWDSLSEKLKQAYKMRQETEQHIKAYLKTRSGKEDYVPFNEYGKFIKKEIEAGGVKKCNNKFFYDVFQKWLKAKKLAKHK